MRLTQLVQLRRIDVHVDHFGMRCEGIELTGHAIVKARADGDQQIALLYRQVGRLSAVHSQHAEIIGIISIHHAQPFQGAGCRHPGHRQEFAQSRYRLRHADPAANVQHRLLRLGQHLQSLRHFRLRKCHLIGDGREMGIEVALRHLNILRDINQHRTWTA